MATTVESDVDIFGYYREGKRLALQLFTMREGDIVGRREFFWEDLPEEDFNPAAFLERSAGAILQWAGKWPGRGNARLAREITRKMRVPLNSSRARFMFRSSSTIASCWRKR